MKIERQSGIELLRILAACLIVLGHIVSRVLELSQSCDANIVLANIVSAISACGVNVFYSSPDISFQEIAIDL